MHIAHVAVHSISEVSNLDWAFVIVLKSRCSALQISDADKITQKAKNLLMSFSESILIKIKTNIAETVFPRITVADKQAVILLV